MMAGACVIRLHQFVVFIAAQVLVLASALAQSQTQESIVDVARFFNISGNALYHSLDAAKALRSKDAAAADAFEKSLAHWNQDVADDRVAKLLRTALTDEDVATIRRFMDTPAGKRLGQFFRGPPPMFASSLASLSAQDRQKIVAFLGSAPAMKVLRASNSDDAAALWRAHGEELTCKHFETSDRVALARLHLHGKCPASSSATGASLASVGVSSSPPPGWVSAAREEPGRLGILLKPALDGDPSSVVRCRIDRHLLPGDFPLRTQTEMNDAYLSQPLNGPDFAARLTAVVGRPVSVITNGQSMLGNAAAYWARSTAAEMVEHRTYHIESKTFLSQTPGFSWNITCGAASGNGASGASALYRESERLFESFFSSIKFLPTK